MSRRRRSAPPVRDNAGRIWQNREKRSDKSPDYGGEVIVAGVAYRVSAWYSPPRSGDEAPSYGLRFEPKAEADRRRAERSSAPRDEPPPQRGFDDEIPF